FSPEKIQGDTVFQQDSILTVKEKEDVKLHCNFTTADLSPYLFWYQQYPGDSLKYILRKNKNGIDDKATGFNRFDAQLERDNTIILKIESVEVKDAAVYYCALSRT
uniref:Ig-like domain-containing protein n=1 Tax=Latimeria chalumnae TaxID=7897 RepID=H3ASF5_LATCH